MNALALRRSCRPRRSWALLGVLVLLAAGCRGGDGGGVEPTLEPPRAPTPTTPGPTTPTPRAIDPTPSPTPPASDARTGLWLIEVATGRKVVLWEGDGSASGRFEPDGEAVTALIVLPDARRAVRFDLEGAVIEEYTGRSVIVTSSDGRSRYFVEDVEPEVADTDPADTPDAETTPDPNAPSVAESEPAPTQRLVLERDGVEVLVPFPEGTFAVEFSPSGDRLLAGTGRLSESGTELIWTYTAYSVLTGRPLFIFQSRTLEGGTDGGQLPRWSPSGRYIADLGLDGLVVHDTLTGEATVLSAGGLPWWSPIEDALIVVTEEDTAEVVRFPTGRRTVIERALPSGSGVFDRSGRYVYWWDGDGGGRTLVFNASNGVLIAEWAPGATSDIFFGVHPIVGGRGAPAAALDGGAPDCAGIEVHHPALASDGLCVDGHSPRWAPDAASFAYTRGSEILIFDVESAQSRVIASGAVAGGRFDGALARWNAAGTHLLIQWPWRGIGWSE